ncbi:hypothetical protein FBF83_13815 [Pseudalkalibacillus hwajinpoensis]|uniref:RING finger protein Z zinc finger domain-containing protein n=1 Tax=Guptibacillus hwajinpoensis TaxID=208199 RepID=A0A4V5Q1L9_9BACL|nr:hypothetical protein FBF83_13815 [Pseudalkalibacillus hwajinpoensis]
MENYSSNWKMEGEAIDCNNESLCLDCLAIVLATTHFCNVLFLSP